MSRVDQQRLERQLAVLKELRDLNLIEPKDSFEYSTYEDSYRLDSELAEDTIAFQLRYAAGRWSGNYQEFTNFCKMVRQLSSGGGRD